MPIPIKRRFFARGHGEIRKLGSKIGAPLFTGVIAHLENDILVAGSRSLEQSVELNVHNRRQVPLATLQAFDRGAIHALNTLVVDWLVGGSWG